MELPQEAHPCGDQDCFGCPAYLAEDDAALREQMASRLGITADKYACPFGGPAVRYLAPADPGAANKSE